MSSETLLKPLTVRSSPGADGGPKVHVVITILDLRGSELGLNTILTYTLFANH